MVAIKLKFWSPPKVDREREKEWKSSDVWRQKLLTTKLLRPCVQQIMFNTILIYRSAEKHLYSKVSPNIDIKTFHVAINTLNHLIFSHHTLCHHTLWLIIWLMINKFSKFFFPFFFLLGWLPIGDFCQSFHCQIPFSLTMATKTVATTCKSS